MTNEKENKIKTFWSDTLKKFVTIPPNETDESKITVNCDSCDNSDYGTKTELETIGWRIEKGLELCPVCNFG